MLCVLLLLVLLFMCSPSFVEELHGSYGASLSDLLTEDPADRVSSPVSNLCMAMISGKFELLVH